MNLLTSRSAATPIKSQPLSAAILIIDVPLLQVIVWKLLDSFTQLGEHLNKQMETVAKIWSYIAKVEDHIIILKKKLSIIEDYAVGTQDILMEMIDISGFIVEYLRENGRTADAEVVKVAKDE